VRHWTRVKYWLPALAWAGLISSLSTDAFSSNHTSVVIVPVLRWLFSHASTETIEWMHEIIRKMAHLTEYFILGVLLHRALRGDDRGWKLKWAFWAIVIAAAYASLDEFHQSFVPSRTASPWDAMLDTVGASAAQIVGKLLNLRNRMISSN
jgi:VanZ family protein